MAERDPDEELPAEELAEVEPEIEEGGEPSSIDPLVVKGIKWTEGCLQGGGRKQRQLLCTNLQKNLA